MRQEAAEVNQKNMEKVMRMGTLISLPLWILIGLYSTGCSFSGMELGGKVGLYGIKDRDETIVTKSRGQPLRCLWDKCGEAGEAQGS
jgi:hypothetical protein